MRDDVMKLWYDRPAENWHQALPVGNGHLGCMARYSADEPGRVNCSIQFRRESGTVSRCFRDDSILLEGRASQAGKHLGVRFAGVVTVSVCGGVAASAGCVRAASLKLIWSGIRAGSQPPQFRRILVLYVKCVIAA